MFLELKDLQHLSSITHEGKVVVFAVDSTGKIFYTVRQDGFEDNYGKTKLTGWEDWTALNFPDLPDDPSVTEKERQEFFWGTDPREGSFILHSVFKQREQTIAAPVQLVSALGFLYVFRPSTNSTILVDRFVLDGMSNKLIPKLDVRFKASKQKYKPLEASQVNGNFQADSLDFRDANGNYFYEPTLELDYIGGIWDGQFCVVLLPTAEHDHYRWHFFTAAYQQVELISIRASDNGLFDVRDDVQMAPGAGPQGTDAWMQSPGLLHRTIALDNQTITGRPAATQYDLQVERSTQVGPQLLRESTRVMLAAPTDQGVVTLSFAAALDGTLAMIEETPDATNLLVNRAKEILLPINTLDQIQAVGSSQPLPQGSITGMARGDADRVTIFTDNPAPLKPGDMIDIGGTASYDGHYVVSATNNGTFDIQAAFTGSQLGHWQAAPSDQGLTFDGMISAYEISPDGKLRVHCANHGLQPGDEVQIVDTRDYNGSYPVLSVLSKSFSLDIPWQPGKGVNLKLESRKRRGIALDGQADYLETSGLSLTHLSRLDSGGQTLSAWVYVNNPASGQEQLIAGRKDGLMELLVTPDGKAALRVAFADGPITLEDTQALPAQQWTHLAASFAYDPQTLDTTLRLCRNGGPVCAEGPARSFRFDNIADYSLVLDGQDDYVDLLNPQVLNIVGRITLEAWVKPNSLDGTQIILAHGSPNGSGGTGLFLGIKDGAYQVGLADGTNKVASHPVEAGDVGQWIHLAGVYDGAAWQLYKNEQPVNSFEAAEGSVKINAPWAIGAWGGGQAGFCKGQVDEVRIWRTARTAAEIQETAGKRLLGNEPGLAGYWAFTALHSQLGQDGALPGQDVKVEDSSRQKNPGVVYGSPRLDAGAALTAAHLPQSPLAWAPDLWVGGVQILVKDENNPDGAPVMQRCLNGKLSDLQVWDLARSPRDIENSMYLQLLGRETGLAGYWRLESITEGTARTSTDFSVFGHDILVHGNAYVGARTLSRKLGDNTTLAVKYINEDTVAVSQRATYIETFEFKVTPSLDPNQADADGKPLFAFAYWGKASQGAADVIAFNGQANRFEPAGESGWYLASCTFTVPDGVSLVRTFGISDIRGGWDQLDIRRHHLRMVSGSITETHYSETLTLDTLGAPQAVLEGYLQSLAQKELEEPTLIAEKLRLQSQLAALNLDAPAVQQNIDTARQRLAKTTRDRNIQLDLLNSVKNNPLNYVVHLRSSLAGPSRILALRPDYGVQLVDAAVAEQREPQTWYFELRGDGYYSIRKSGMPNMSLGVNPLVWLLVLDADTNSDSQAWQIQSFSGYYRLVNKQWGLVKALDVDPATLNGRLSDARNYPGQFWSLDIVGGPTNKQIELAQIYFNQADSDFSSAQQVLTHWLEIQQNGDALRQAGQQRLQQVIQALNTLQNEIAGLRDSYLKDVSPPAPLSLPDLQTDSRNLTTGGALLGFVQAASGLNLLATSEGNVQLSYFDTDGRMRQTVYDATSDSSRNDTYQVWLQDGLRVGLNFEAPGARLLPKNPIPIGEEWSLETWFAYPLANAGVVTNQPEASWAPLDANTLASGPGGSLHVTVRNGLLGSMQGTEFWSAGFNMSQLSYGWHHLAVVGVGSGKTSTTRFYIDGRLVGDTRSVRTQDIQNQIKALQDQIDQRKKQNPAASISDLTDQITSAQTTLNSLAELPFKVKSSIRTLGNTNLDPVNDPNNTPKDEPFGKIAELRIHQIALSAEEVEINSKVSLSGNEPGLAVYYRMDEASGTTARNAARPVDDLPMRAMGQASPPDSSAYDADLQGRVSWWPCAAPIGNPGYSVMGFDGLDDHVVASGGSLPSQNNAFTVETWFRANALPKDASHFAGILAWGSQTDAQAGFWLRLSADGIELNGQNKPVEGLIGGWHHLAVIYEGASLARSLYLDGQRLFTDGWAYNFAPATAVRIGWTRNQANSELIEDPFNGAITEVRVWNHLLSERDLRAHMRMRLSAGMDRPDVYFALQAVDSQVQAFGANIRTDNGLPLTGSEVISAEYSTLGTDTMGRQTAMMRRFLACPAQDSALLLTGKRIETLERVWIGNTQFQPTLLGFIEGAPPVPSENLTERDDYSGATQAELVVSDDMAYSWTREQDAGLGANLSMFLGVDAQEFTVEAPLGVGIITTGASQHFGAKEDLNIGYSFLNNSTISAANSASSSDRIMLTGTAEAQIKFEALGRRFIPKNIGYALVVSGLADVYVLRLKRSGKMVAYQVLPNPDVPFDVNTITFMINPAYTMNGSLDGLTGSQATSGRFYQHVPEMRARYGSRYPASYYRIQEAYQLKQTIANQDKERESYFENFNSLLVDETSVNRNINTPAQMPSQSESDARQKEIQQKIQDQEQMVHAQASFAAWQRRMEDLQVKAGKRNIVNTYVWDSDGGLRAESQSFANTVEHTVGGSFSLDGAFGIEASFDVFGLDLELTAQATVHVTQTMTKTMNSSRGFALNIDLSGLESTGITDYNGLPILPGEKVSRYRLMSFYLEGSTDHYAAFFNEVVDPEWLQSNSEEARALRKVQTGKANKTWRVLHRVTYVERPALMGFGQDVRKQIQSADTSATLDSLQAGISQIQAAGQKLQAEFDSVISEFSALGSAGADLKQQFDAMQQTLQAIQQALASKQPGQPQQAPGKPNK